MKITEILAEGDRLEAQYKAQHRLADQVYCGNLCNDYWDMHLTHLVAVARAASALFAALDHVTPGWRENTCVINEDSDEVNVAWCELESALEDEFYTRDEIRAALAGDQP